MNPPLHAIALLRQKVSQLNWTYLKQHSLPALTLLMLSCYTSSATAHPLDVNPSSKPDAASYQPDYGNNTNLPENTSTDFELRQENADVPILTSEIDPIISRRVEPIETINLKHTSTARLNDLDNVFNKDFSNSQPSQNQERNTLEPTIQHASQFISQLPPTAPARTSPIDTSVSRRSQDLSNPFVQVQGVYTLQGEESSGRGRVSASYAITPNLLIGGTVDLTGGRAFSDSPEEGIDLNELYVAVSPSELPNLRFVVGMLDLTAYFDRNSFAKDAATQFLNPVFQSNPALTAAGLGSRPAILVNWAIADPIEIKVAGFSSNRDLGNFALDGFAGEVGLRLGNFLVRGTYITDRDAGQDSGFEEIFQLARGSDFGLRSGDREAAYGVNAEFFIPEAKLGLFARYGHYENLELDRGGSTYSVGLNFLDLFLPYDRLGLAYGQRLSNADLRRGDYPDVWELFYDVRITPNLRAGVTLQASDQFSETIAGFRIRADFDSRDFGRLFR